MWHVSLLRAGYFLRNIDSVPVDVCIKDQNDSLVLKNEQLRPNGEVFLSHYYLQSVRALALKVFFARADKKEKDNKLSFNIDYDSEKNIYNVHGIDDYLLCDIATLYARSNKMRTIVPHKITLEKPISGYYLRNIDGVRLSVVLKQYKKELKTLLFNPNQEFYFDPSFLKDNQIHEIKLTVYPDDGISLYTVSVPSPIKQCSYEKVYNILRHTNGFFSKHIKNEEMGTESIAVRKIKGVTFDEFYKRTGLYKPRAKAQSILDLDLQAYRPH